ncbi:dipeptidase D [Dethiosulfatibacter aminovorans DSM 17477]|uniref:Dipeptidase D n=1 Tax=Dethiosulfatibacter aminovorans DSM 17477 TaxID=1121476 RepID=A0A1M6BMH9_9FIRM|nr:beta-Ala-His dipeptidase [Dethiosulfatibacter aminovorans]SHI49931.1 dipeptidase D [Dethiosulfatibacter aminovorans DSM 17477]
MIDYKDSIIENFRTISKIPRASGDEKRISDFLAAYARTKNLDVHQDDFYNLIIKKKSTIENYSGPAVILQGHMDMVYVKDSDSEHEYSEGIDVYEKDGFLYSKGTSLGADNGIAISYLMNLMDSKDIPHPDLEIVITVQEEVGLAGAAHIDASKLKGKNYINLDAENEGFFFVSCAGGVRSETRIPLYMTPSNSEKYSVKISVSGLKGGHSGMEIDKMRGNAIVLMARVLKYVGDHNEISLSNIECDGKANAIPNICRSSILCSDPEKINDDLRDMEAVLNSELNPLDQVKIETEVSKNESTISVYTKYTFSKIISMIQLLPNGVIHMDKSLKDMVETSANIGAIHTENDKLILLSSIRSSAESRKNEIIDKIKSLANIQGCESVFFNNYPGWEFNPDSSLRKISMESYTQLTGKEATLSSIHAGLECGYFDNMIENLDIVAFGPDVFDVHSPKERISIESAARIFELIVLILKKLSA